jgi:DNA-binding NtrC family response regulator
MPDSIPSQHRRVLVIDDNHAIHADFKKILKPASEQRAALDELEAAFFGEASSADQTTQFDIDSAFQGQEGLARIKDARAAGQPYALAFVDVRMPPGWDGVETVSQIWTADPEVQVVICTAYSDYAWDEVAKKLTRPDQLMILKKPFDNIEVLQLTHALTEKWRLAQAAKQRLEELQSLVRELTRKLAKSKGKAR